MNSRFAILTVMLAVASCSTDVRDIGRAPHMTAVGTGLNAPSALPPGLGERAPRIGPVRSLWDDGSSDLFRDARASKMGDLITVVIAINDRAVFGSTSERSRDSKITNSFDGAGNMPYLVGSIDGTANANGTTSTKGDAKINRSEQIQLSVAAVVREILPNGNLLISGSQEVRVNFELRELNVSGIVRPRDVSRDNTISYDKVAEARISYGGRGRMSEVQQPALLHQIFDLLRPF